MGGSLRFESGDKPWTVLFTKDGKKEKYKRFSQENEAKKYRRTYSNLTGRTTNIWRLRPNDPKTIEMIIGPEEVVLFETRFSQELLRFEWHLGARGRVYTTGRVRTSPEGVNAEAKPIRDVPPNRQVSMLHMLNPDVKNPRRLTPIANGIIDNRLHNFTTLGEANHVRYQEKLKDEKAKKEAKKEKKKAKKEKKKATKKRSSRKKEDTPMTDASASGAVLSAARDDDDPDDDFFASSP